VVESYILQGRTVEEKILATLLLLNETKSAVRYSCDCSLCHADVLSAIETCRQSAGAIKRRPMTITEYTINYNQALPSETRAVQLWGDQWRRARAAWGWAARRRQAAASAVSPEARRRPMAVLRSRLRASGRAPQWTWEASSPKVTSRT